MKARYEDMGQNQAATYQIGSLQFLPFQSHSVSCFELEFI